MGGQTDADNFHNSVWDRDTLRGYLHTVGFQDVEPFVDDIADTSQHKVSLNLQAVKPKRVQDVPREEPQDIKIAACMSIPRIGWNDSWLTIIDALRPFGIGVRTFSGVFWGQCLQRVMLEAVEDGVDWILVLDFDSMITKKHLDTLFMHLGRNPGIDAIAPLQVKRGGEGVPLLTVGEGVTEQVVDGKPFKVTTAHFGCTVIRTDALKRMPLPWFLAVPGPDGRYEGPTKLDEDIYFWQEWKKAGNTVYVAPDVRIGHLELQVAEIRDDMTSHHVPVRQWREANK